MSEPVRQFGQKGVFLRGFTTKGTTISVLFLLDIKKPSRNGLGFVKC